MIDNKEDIRIYNARGLQLNKQIRSHLCDLLVNERIKRNLTTTQLSKILDIPTTRTERQEIWHRKINWQVIAAMLNLYKKRIVLQLEDDTEEHNIP